MWWKMDRVKSEHVIVVMALVNPLTQKTHESIKIAVLSVLLCCYSSFLYEKKGLTSMP